MRIPCHVCTAWRFLIRVHSGALAPVTTFRGHTSGCGCCHWRTLLWFTSVLHASAMSHHKVRVCHKCHSYAAYQGCSMCVAGHVLPCCACRFTNKRVTIINTSPLFAKTVRVWDGVHAGMYRPTAAVTAEHHGINACGKLLGHDATLCVCRMCESIVAACLVPAGQQHSTASLRVAAICSAQPGSCAVRSCCV